MFIGPAEDRLKIRERLDSYGDAVCRQDLADYLACWTEDGERLRVFLHERQTDTADEVSH